MKEYVKTTRKQLQEFQKSGDWDRFFETCVSASLILFRHQEWKESVKIIQECLKKSQSLKSDDQHGQMVRRLEAYLLFFEGLEKQSVAIRTGKWTEVVHVLRQLEFIPQDINIIAPCYNHFLQQTTVLEERFRLLVEYLYLAGREDVLDYVYKELDSYQEYLRDMAIRHQQLETVLLNITSVPLEILWRTYWILMRFKYIMQDYHGVLELAANVQALIDNQNINIPFDELVTVHQWSFYSALHVGAQEEAIQWINSISRYIRYQPYFIKENEIILGMHVAILEFNGDTLNEWKEVLSHGLPVLEFLQSPQEAYISETARLAALVRVLVLLSKAHWAVHQDIDTALEYGRAARTVFEKIELDENQMASWDNVELYYEELWRESLNLPNPSPWRLFNHVNPDKIFLERINAVGTEHQEELLLLWLYVLYRIKGDGSANQHPWWQQLTLMRQSPWPELRVALLENDATKLPPFEREKNDPLGVIGIVRPLIEPRLTMSVPHLKSVIKHSPDSHYAKSLLITEAVLMGNFVAAMKFWNEYSAILKTYKDGGDLFTTVLRFAIMKYLSSMLDDRGQSRELPPDQADAFHQLKSLSACFVDDDQLKYLYVRAALWKRGKIPLWPRFED